MLSDPGVKTVVYTLNALSKKHGGLPLFTGTNWSAEDATKKILNIIHDWGGYCIFVMTMLPDDCWTGTP